MTEAGDRVGHESELHRERVDPLVVCEAPKALETVKQTVLGGEDAPLGGGRVGASEFGKAEGAFLEDGADEQGDGRRGVSGEVSPAIRQLRGERVDATPGGVLRMGAISKRRGDPTASVAGESPGVSSPVPC